MSNDWTIFIILVLLFRSILLLLYVTMKIANSIFNNKYKIIITFLRLYFLLEFFYLNVSLQDYIKIK